MRKTLPAVAAAAAATVAFCAASAGAAAINVLHGADGETVSVARPGINVVRGGPATAVPEPTAEISERTARYAVAGGEVLWLIDSRTGLLTACTKRGTSNVGQSRIHCKARYLP